MKKMMNDEVLLTQQKLDEIKKELEHLINVERVNVIQEIKDARSQGDLSENAEYDVAREKQGIIESKIREFEAIIAKAKIIETRSGSKRVSIGSKVTLKNLESGLVQTFQIVSSIDADPFANKISNFSPIAQVLLGQHEGDEVEVDVNEKYSVKILEVTNE
ncbi:transcription elongation factor GreA [Mesomycoplasma ovipneumoniae]|uniref:Transcription elongation factor GreA n=2 Tax=Mesomycoplasma ovipneumoniae TaxID=29562 RepID=A0AAJ2P7X6_9BACT|nr:transcription elongation factor GreA [Mesomycoplasma ovipneumoniae]MCP9306765.1 transcription elongation factor GreA [Mesomycoplasma ovipneumoniae]MDW2829537.1 transcription elongation factor GreA [Mesomycoplasma ovipneumoniae]MDW2834377.1 transcription elongation factor GreA [Mesomycoplasma ovipneumoniae]MDW2834509.1 transcription elongation factor GreA [Mesomycoplasma ovipneumoniae]MDW2835320.1 transcription elongation factor GreA [Mesomycoplasma ovipneumoniae]